MIFIAIIWESLAALWANRLRSSLVVLGMVMGVASVITIVSTVEGMQSNIEEVFDSLGPKSFMVSRIGFGLTMAEYLERLRRRKLTRGLIPLIEEGCPDCADVGAQGYASDRIKFGNRSVRRVSIEGQTPNMLDITSGDVATGRFLSWEDDHRRRNVAYIGFRVADKLFHDEDPIGQRVKIGNNEFRIIGVAEEMGGMFGEDMDEFIIMPLSTLQKIYPQPGNPVNLIIDAVSLERRERAIEQVRMTLRAARGIPYEHADDFQIFTPEAVLSFINNFTRAFRVIMVSLPLVSIIVGGIVIMNIMMISVTERTREIGIRKALGAQRRHILFQFLYESIILSLIGGGIGILVGIWAGEAILTSWMDIQFSPTTMAIVLGFGISTGVGLFFGIYPAAKASRLDPIEALGFE